MRNDTQMTGMIKWYKENWHGMTGWLWNESSSRIKGFALVKKMSLHFSSFSHSVIIFTARNGAKMARMSLEWTLSIANFHSMSFYAIKNDAGMTAWGGMREFFEGRKNWIFWRLPFCHHSTIPTSFHVDDSLILWTILEWAGMKGKWGLNDLIRCFLL